MIGTFIFEAINLSINLLGIEASESSTKALPSSLKGHDNHLISILKQETRVI
jgi:hypothetical protein